MSGFSIRPFATIEEFRDCVDLQESTWGVGFSERVSPAILKVGQMLGGVSAGAYDAQGGLVGFVFGLTGVRDGEVVHWSDMLAVRPEVRDTGLGRRLKAYQRERVMELGVEKMFWTFDPLRSRNAHLNLTRLGIVVREYAEDMYGQTDSPLHRGIGTDRFIALWLLRSERVRRAVAAIDARAPGGVAESSGSVDGRAEGRNTGTGTEDSWPAHVADAPLALDVDAPAESDLSGSQHPGGPRAGSPPPEGSRPGPGALRPASPDLDLAAPALRVTIPTDLDAVMEVDLGLAVAWRRATRAVFRHYLDDGYEVRFFRRGTPTSTYGLVRRDDPDD